MAGPRRWVTGWVLQIMPHGEKFERYNLFTTDMGYQIALGRLSRKGTTKADFWDWAELCLETPGQGGEFAFLVDYRLVKRAEFLGRNFEALQAAAQWARLLIENLRWIEDPKPIETITRGFLEALEAGNSAELTIFKAIFKFASMEGFAVRGGWWAELPSELRAAAAVLLQTPAASLDPALLVHLPVLHKGLTEWLSRNTAIRV